MISMHVLSMCCTVLRVGPVNVTYNQSSYQYSIVSNGSSVVSSTGILTVAGECVRICGQGRVLDYSMYNTKRPIVHQSSI